MQLSPDQEHARQAILSALSEGAPVSVLVGPAGSGKTTLLRALLADLTRDVTLLCPTGKAAARLTEVTGQRARTVHRALYGRVKEVDDEQGRTRLVFDGKQAPCPPGGLVVCDEDRKVDMKALQGAIGSARLSFGKPDLLFEVLGVRPGSVTPFALVNDAGRQVKVVLDAAMMKKAPLHYHPLLNDRTTRIAPDDLLRFIDACGHAPVVVDLDAADAGPPAAG